MIINPVIYDERGRGTDIFSLNMKERVIHLVGPINDELAASVVAQLLHLAADGEEDIKLYINSPGGSVSAGMAIYDTMQFIAPDVATVCVGRAASMGAVLLSGGAKGKRSVLEHGEVMIHQPSGGVEGQATDMVIEAEHIKRVRSTLVQLLAENCGKTPEETEKSMERDYWMSAEDAMQYGIVDKITRKEKEDVV
ncbi:MAG: ATP-dependent Clp protease proteolytic subunit [Lachnospiraceae bacterium]|nr:ATP-dependent Clp protease proteolytic subunit [Lachnospiraceae bacterium]